MVCSYCAESAPSVVRNGPSIIVVNNRLPSTAFVDHWFNGKTIRVEEVDQVVLCRNEAQLKDRYEKQIQCRVR